MNNYYLLSDSSILSAYFNHTERLSSQKPSSYCILSTIGKEYQTGYPVFLYIITHLRYNTISYL